MSDTEYDSFIFLHHPLLDVGSLPSTASDVTGLHSLDSDLLDNLSLCDTNALVDSPSTSGEPDATSTPENRGTGIPITSYDGASSFISRFMSSPTKGGNAELDLLRALMIELGLRSPTASDLPCTLTSARKVLKAEAHVNIKEYVATRHKGHSALREILKPSKAALRKEIRKGNGASLQWVKEHGLQVLLITCFT